jgi:hypothetical protein
MPRVDTNRRRCSVWQHLFESGIGQAPIVTLERLYLRLRPFYVLPAARSQLNPRLTLSLPPYPEALPPAIHISKHCILEGQRQDTRLGLARPLHESRPDPLRKR